MFSFSHPQSETLNQKCILDELECRKIKLKERLTSLRAESEEIWKSMEEAERNLSEIVGAKDYDTTRCFSYYFMQRKISNLTFK